MSTYTIDYSNLDGRERMAKAITDITNYLGLDKFLEFSLAAQADRQEGHLTNKQFRFATMMIGVQGYPAKAWHTFIFGKEPVYDDDQQETA